MNPEHTVEWYEKFTEYKTLVAEERRKLQENLQTAVGALEVVGNVLETTPDFPGRLSLRLVIDQAAKRIRRNL